MFNLLVKSGGWADTNDTFDETRVLEYTEPQLKDSYLSPAGIDYTTLTSFPALFLDEARRGGNAFARVGKIHRVRRGARHQLVIEYTFNPNIAPIHMDELARVQLQLGFTSAFEFNRTHWAVKDVDLYEVIASYLIPRGRTPQLFQLPERPQVDPNQLSVMMPFGGFTAVYQAITRAATANGMACNRADDIWDSNVIMDDVVNLIDRSAIVVCDCTGRNPNVFYEIGLAHAWGKQVILITQNGSDIPFDLAHIRHLRYLNNAEGLAELERQLSARIQILSSPG